MECNIENKIHKDNTIPDLNLSDSSENFQNFIYKLFENNGVLNDLRAYLRGHIVNVLNSVDTGEPPAAHKHFTQRLQRTFQSINIIIAEYLFKMDFNYSFSVFISEIPLSNMIFDFSKQLFNKSENVDSLQFSDNDIWRVLNYIGIKCDSVHASKIQQMYSRSGEPLLTCMLKCLPLHGDPPDAREVDSSEEVSIYSTYSGERSSRYSRQCQHYKCCKTCRSRVVQFKEKYNKKKMHWNEKAFASSSNVVNAFNVEDYASKFKVVEERLMDEMFEQLKNVYEGEIDLVREAEQKKVKHSLATHAMLLHRHRDELEEKMKERESQLEQEVSKKKEFVRELASALRETHARVAAADGLVKQEAGRLTDRENALKTQLEKAEKLLQEKGEEMHKQISMELRVLDGHLQAVRQERDAMDQERRELESLKRASLATVEMSKLCSTKEKEELMKEYALMRSELATLKKYIETTKAEGKAMNNEYAGERVGEDRPRQGQGVNDLRKQNNINSQTNMDSYRYPRKETWSWQEAASGGAHEVESYERALRSLRDENERLKEFAKQQGSHIELLTLGLRQTQTQAAVARPQSAPAAVQPASARLNARVDAGRGEELRAYAYAGAGPRAGAPGEAVPFIGVVGGRRAGTRRYPTWLGLRRGPPSRADQTTPRRADGAGPTAPRFTARSDVSISRGARHSTNGRLGSQVEVTAENTEEQIQKEEDERDYLQSYTRRRHHQSGSVYTANASERRAAPQQMEKLRKKQELLDSIPTSPNKMMRETKLRLRKLELEAEAVELSYRSYRRKRDEEKLQGLCTGLAKPATAVVNEYKRNALTSKKSHDQPKTHLNTFDTKIGNQINMDYDKYLREYQRWDGRHILKNKNTAMDDAKPIPCGYSEISKDDDQDPSEKMSINYLETPLLEFRKLYPSDKPLYRTEKTKTFNKQQQSLTDNDKSQRLELENGKSNALQNTILQSEEKKIYDTSSLETLKGGSSNSSKNDNSQYNINKPSISNVEEPLKDDNKSLADKPDLLKPNSEINISNSNDASNGGTEGLTNPLEVTNLLEVEIEDCKVVSKMADVQDLVISVQASLDSTKLAGAEIEEGIMTPQTTVLTPKEERQINKAPDFKLTEYDVHSIDVTLDINKEISKGDIISPYSPTAGQTPPSKGDSDNQNISNKESLLFVDNKVASVIDNSLNLNNEKSIESHDKDFDAEYLDDFSADVDNYNSRSEDNSPMSILKTSEEENFWES